MRPALNIKAPASLALLLALALVPIAAQQAATKPPAQPAPSAAAAQKPEATPAAAAAPRAMELSDIIAWKNIGATALSHDGTLGGLPDVADGRRQRGVRQGDRQRQGLQVPRR